MAKTTIVQETCDQCGKIDKTFPMVIHMPDKPAVMFDLCHIDYDALLAITGGEPYDPKKYKVNDGSVPKPGADDKLQAATEKKAVKRYQQWDEEETKFLLNNPLMSHQDAALALHRTFYAVRTRRIKMRAEGHIV